MSVDEIEKLLKMVGDSGLPLSITVVTVVFVLWVAVRWLPSVYRGVMEKLEDLVQVTKEGHLTSHTDREKQNAILEKKLDQAVSSHLEIAHETLKATKETWKQIVDQKEEVIAAKDSENKALYERLIEAAKGNKNV